jgi:hypothetical protein
MGARLATGGRFFVCTPSRAFNSPEFLSTAGGFNAPAEIHDRASKWRCREAAYSCGRKQREK